MSMKQTKKSDTIHNLHEFLKWQKFKPDERYAFGKSFARKNPCRPWFSYLQLFQPEYAREVYFHVNRTPQGIRILALEGQRSRGLLKFEDFPNFGADYRGIVFPDVATSLPAYRKYVEKLASEPYTGYQGIRVLDALPADRLPPDQPRPRRSTKGFWVTCTQLMPQVVLHIRYDGMTGRVNNADCIGLEFGAGSGPMEVGPYTLWFPFTKQEFQQTVALMDKEAYDLWDDEYFNRKPTDR